MQLTAVLTAAGGGGWGGSQIGAFRVRSAADHLTGIICSPPLPFLSQEKFCGKSKEGCWSQVCD